MPLCTQRRQPQGDIVFRVEADDVLRTFPVICVPIQSFLTFFFVHSFPLGGAIVVVIRALDFVPETPCIVSPHSPQYSFPVSHARERYPRPFLALWGKFLRLFPANRFCAARSTSPCRLERVSRRNDELRHACIRHVRAISCASSSPPPEGYPRRRPASLNSSQMDCMGSLRRTFVNIVTARTARYRGL